VEANTIKSRRKKVALLSKRLRGLDEVIITLRETLGNCVLKRSRVDEGEKLLCRANRSDELGSCARPPDLPTRKGEGLCG